jgi:competence protein ComFC
LAKHYGNRLAAKQIGRLMWERTDLRFADFDIIVPVPLHWTRYAWRWFNQAEVIAQELSIKSGKPVVHLLKRVKLTQYQTGLTRHKRLTNLNGAFELTDQAKQFEDKKILLIDDVMTTGTTLHRCFRAIIKMQPKSLKAGVACRTL